jgi:hypothetical protein
MLAGKDLHNEGVERYEAVAEVVDADEGLVGATGFSEDFSFGLLSALGCRHPWQTSVVRRTLSNQFRTGTDKGNLTV